MGFKKYDLRVAFSMATISMIMGFGAPGQRKGKLSEAERWLSGASERMPQRQWFPPVRSPWTHCAGQAVGDRCQAASEGSRLTGIKVRDAGSGGEARASSSSWSVL